MPNPKSASRFSTASKNYTKFPNKILHTHVLDAVEKIIIAFIGSVAVCYASQHGLAKVCGVSIDSVRRSLRRLENRKIIAVEKRRGRTAILSILPSGDWDLTPSKSSEVTPSNESEQF